MINRIHIEFDRYS